MVIADPLSRLARQANQPDNLDLPLMLEMLLKELSSTVRNALSIRMNAEKDTIVSLVYRNDRINIQSYRQYDRINIRQDCCLNICPMSPNSSERMFRSQSY
jgi:hypothetical protein